MFRKLFTFITMMSVMGLNVIPAMAECTNVQQKIEHLDVHKNAPCNEVVITGENRTVREGNVLLFAFDQKFFSKCQKAGEIVHFTVPQAIYTREGSLILPADSKVVAEVIGIEKPKMFNKNARVNLIFRKIVLPDGSCIDIKARPFTKDCKLKEGPWTTAGKLALSTISMGMIGAGAGVGFAFIPNPAKIGTGLAIGIPIGCSVGLVIGLITPGCHYKAKKGEEVYAILIDEFCVQECQ